MFESGDVVTFAVWLPHSKVGKVIDRAAEDPNFWLVRSFREGKERWYHQDSLQLHVPEVDPEKPWEAK